MSEAQSALECQNTAYNVVHGDPKRPRVANAVTLPGTYGHYFIARDISDEIGCEPPTRPKLNAGTKKIIDGWRAIGRIEEELYKPAKNCLRNWRKFWNDYEITPLRVEHTMNWTVLIDGGDFRIAGTLDFIGRVKMTGTLDEQGLFHRCMHAARDPLCTCEPHEVITFMDWKYSKSPQDSHPVQLAAYRIGSRRTGLDEILTQHGKYPMNYHNWSLLFKTPLNVPPAYQLKSYPYDMIEDFFIGCRILMDPKPLCLNYYTGNMGVRFFCTFCAEKLNCPINGYWVPESSVNDQVSDEIMTVF